MQQSRHNNVKAGGKADSRFLLLLFCYEFRILLPLRQFVRNIICKKNEGDRYDYDSRLI